MDQSTETSIYPALTRGDLSDIELLFQAFLVSVHEGLSLSLALFELGHAFYSVFAKFEGLFQPVLLGLSLGERAVT